MNWLTAWVSVRGVCVPLSVARKEGLLTEEEIAVLERPTELDLQRSGRKYTTRDYAPPEPRESRTRRRPMGGAA